jgi:amino acid adenylation domain-containing protein
LLNVGVLYMFIPLTESQRGPLLVEWDKTKADFPRDKCLHQWFEAQVARTPEAVAVVFEQKRLTYRELNQRANQLAHYLKKLGVGPEVLVGIYMARSLEMVVGLLGILKAGGAYLPLEPTYPQERLAFMLEEAQTPVLLTQEQGLPGIPPIELGGNSGSLRLVCLETDWAIISEESQENLVSGVKPDNLAYVIYTSGSTGKPKGVMNTHLGICNRLLWMQQAYQLTTDDRVLQKTPFSFDVSVWEFFWPLLAGARLVVAKPEGHRDSAYLVKLIAEQQITTLHFVPSMFQVFVTEPGIENCTSIRQVFCSGEALPFELQKVLFARHKTAQLHNLYGPTEAAIDVTFWQCLREQTHQKTVPIGRPIANTQIYLLDPHLKSVPVGEAGELHIGGLGLARGYLNRPELTQEKFIPNPFSDEIGTRLYKTGDLARYRPDGNIEYLGRLDHQVKMRGFRIELGEIEAVLNQDPAVQQALVIAREDEPGNKRLVAYLVSESRPERTTVAHIRHLLTAKLPDYMIPASFVFLSAMPLTPNGKIDRQALPKPDSARPEFIDEFEAPRTPMEEILAGIWAEVLQLEPVGIHDNFIELGGHSLLATQIISRLRDIFQLELPLQTVLEWPTVAKLAEHVEARRQQTHLLPVPPIEPMTYQTDILLLLPPQPIPLSFPQQQLWLLAQVAPEMPVYNEPFTIRLGGPIDVVALEQSFNEILRRHHALRTTVITVEGQAIQMVSPFVAFKLPVVDLDALPANARESEAVRQATAVAKQPFDLSTYPLFRATLMPLDEQDYRLFLTFHHIIIDGVSIYEILLPELETLYQAFSNGEPSPLSPPTLQYTDFALWQRQWLQADVLEEQLAYWKQHLAELSTLQLPTDRPRPARPSHRGARHCLALSKALTEALKALSRQEGVTLFVTMLAAFKTLLHRYSGQDDIVVGTVTAGRNRAELQQIMGDFLNTLVLRSDLSDNPSFRQLLRRVRDVTLGAYAHQDLPFEQLVDKLQPVRRPGTNPLFQVAFTIEPLMPLLDLGWTINQLDIHPGSAKFDLYLELDEKPDGMTGRIEYNTDLFEEATIARMGGHYQTLLEGIVANPEQRLSDLPLLTAPEQQQLLEWNHTQTDFPKTVCIHQLFENQVERTPDAVAIVFDGKQLSYRELNGRANQLAHHLISLGVKPEALVGICVERSIEMIVGLLGILKAGGAYVPLDPAYPPVRLTFMLADAQVPVLLTQQHLLGRLPKDEPPVICIDTDWETIAKETEENSRNQTTVDNLAYVIYTSGSTGKPKGVSVTHRSVIRLVKNTNYVNLTADDVFLQIAPISFDASTFEIWGPLVNGSRLVIIPPHVPSLEELGQALQHYQVTTLWLTAGLFHLMVDMRLEELKPVRQLLAGGDVLSVPHVKKVLQTLKGCRLINGYGPTENTTFSCCYPMTDSSQVGNTVPIGHPIANTQVYVLDAHLQRVPIGIYGELYIGGDGLARDYFNRPELTAEKFVPNPFEQDIGGFQNGRSLLTRLYKTGDLVRYLPDGNLEFLGRIDHQVKIRGFRIELGEIEAVLSQHAAVQEAVVIVREDIAGDKCLVAYIVQTAEGCQTSKVCQAEEVLLRRFLKQKLPDYMVPSTFVLLEALPLTPNGKIDRQALPQPRRVYLGTSYIAPKTQIEHQIATIWQTVLHINKVCVHDKFFDLGGNSLLLVQVQNQLVECLNREVSVVTLFEYPTISALAHYLDNDVSEQTDLQVSVDRAHKQKVAMHRYHKHHKKPHLLLSNR